MTDKDPGFNFFTGLRYQIFFNALNSVAVLLNANSAAETGQNNFFLIHE